MTTALTVHRTILIETAFGPSTLVLLRDEDGNHLTWKTAACPRDLIENEEQLRITASFKVKKHDLYEFCSEGHGCGVKGFDTVAEVRAGTTRGEVQLTEKAEAQ